MARSPRAPGAIGSDDYTGFSLILICVGLAILGWTAWKLWHGEISAGALLVAHREMQAIAWVSDRFSQADIGVERADPRGVQFDQLVRLYRNIGTEFLYPAMALVLELAGVLPHSYIFRSGEMSILPNVCDFSERGTLGFLSVTSVFLLLVCSTSIRRIRNALTAAEERISVQAWQLRQLVPEQARRQLE